MITHTLTYDGDMLLIRKVGDIMFLRAPGHYFPITDARTLDQARGAVALENADMSYILTIETSTCFVVDVSMT